MHVMWFDAPESTYHTSFGFEAPFCSSGLCFITKVGFDPFRLLRRPQCSAIIVDFILLDGHVDGCERVTDVLDPGCRIGHRKIFLSDIVELLPELQFPDRCALGSWHPRCSSTADHRH